MKGKLLVIATILVVATLLLAGCNSASNYDGKTKIVYELEGGTYKNCTDSIVQYYDFEQDTENLIYSPQTLSRANVERAGYRFTGWFKTKTQNGDTVTYSDEWDFATDKVTTEGVTLYAGWRTIVTYTYNVCYVDEQGETKSLGTYNVAAGDEFNDGSNYASRRLGNYTPLVYKNKDGDQVGYYLDKEFNNPVGDYKHPGGETDCQINVYVKYIEGKYALVSTAKELTSSTGRNIYLLNDIDMDGKPFRVESYSKKIFEGNGHTIYNFTVPYRANKNDLSADINGTGSNSVYAFIFGKLDEATIQNVTFEGATLKIEGGMSTITDIYVAPFAKEVTNSTVNNVNVSLKYKVVRFPTEDFATKGNFVVFDNGYAIKTESTITNFNVTITKE